MQVSGQKIQRAIISKSTAANIPASGLVRTQYVCLSLSEYAGA